MSANDIVFYAFLALLTVMVTVFNYKLHKQINGEYNKTEK